ncbi:hypothetical protein BGZ60DRAFT_533433 [Tricladium varicosporioides]|nr:hypothetical protein BGZ60DRAFT_533433 [Hymenoscyphus varicosporioides]
MASHHKILNFANEDKLLGLSDPNYYQPGERAFECWMPVTSTFPRQNFPTNPPSVISIETWRKIQAASFCLSARLISQYTEWDWCSGSFGFWSPAALLVESAAWFDINPAEDEEFPYLLEEHPKWDVILHALANKLVGVLCVRLRVYLRERGIDSWTSFPPTALTIPFASFIKLPLPFSLKSVENFGTCHLQQMATPDFFVDREWVGFTAYIGSSFSDEGQSWARSVDSFESFGCDTIIRNPIQNTPGDDLVLEKNVKFKFVAWVDARLFILESNWFQSQTTAHKHKLTVNSSTGIVEVVRRKYIMSIEVEEISTAAITPFGLVIGCKSGQWIWLWKCEWSSYT